ncbi:hypothetical protein GCM10008110_09060 [Marinobacter persicus]|nr:hypothetical protein GCM10008110_09060 [Marinobacter persicus]
MAGLGSYCCSNGNEGILSEVAHNMVCFNFVSKLKNKAEVVLGHNVAWKYGEFFRARDF